MRETFSELTKQVHLINDLILSDMVNTDAEPQPGDEDTSFSRHLLATKHWFSRISWANKKRYVLALLQDLRSAWALSLLLKSMWNCRPKDAVLSVSEQRIWSSYDQVPIDHNRTATPLSVLAHVMKNDRMWFLMQEPEAQAMILSELLIISGGPVMWAVLRRAKFIYERYRDKQLHNLLECVVVEQGPEPGKKELAKGSPDAGKPPTQTEQGRAQKELEANLAAWNNTIKSMRDSLKLEEIEMTFNDGTKQKIWKVNRVKPEAIETVDFLQLLPSCVAKRVFSFLPHSQFSEFAKVNKYWAYLVDEYKAEVAARERISSEFDKLNDIMLQHDVSLELLEQFDVAYPPAPPSSLGNFSTALSMKLKPPPSMKASEKSGGAYSLRHFLNEKFNKPYTQTQTPIRNLAELSEKLERRGAADENIWKWCDNIVLKRSKAVKTKKSSIDQNSFGVMKLSHFHFPCPMMNQTIQVPLHPPLYTDPAIAPPTKYRRNISSMMILQQPKGPPNIKRYGLWSRDFTGLYPVMKIPSYQAPFHK